jgi:phenylpyruvate tautomerase PptA (4-oxalocrotonate tautomerase family)
MSAVTVIRTNRCAREQRSRGLTDLPSHRGKIRDIANDVPERKPEITMPLYKIITPDGLLSAEAQATLVAEITEFHSRLDEAYTKILFNSFPPGDGFIGREAGPAVILTVKVRAGRPADYRKKLLFGLKSLLQRATGAADVQMLLALEETPASNAIEMGELMPEIGA